MYSEALPIASLPIPWERDVNGFVIAQDCVMTCYNGGMRKYKEEMWS